MKNISVNGKLDYGDTQDFKDCLRGYQEMEYPAEIERNGAAIWNFNQLDFIPDIKVPEDYDPDSCPRAVHKSLWRQAQLNKIHGWFQVCEGVYQFRGYDIANLTLVETNNGIVVIDCTTTEETARKALELYRDNISETEREVQAVILTHTHTDHYGGIDGVTGGKSVSIYAPENFVTEAALENVIVGDAMSRRTTYQYGTFLEPGVRSHVDSGLGKGITKGGTVGFAVPTHVVVSASNLSDQHLIPECTKHTIDGMDFEFILCPHTEAPAEMSVYIHEKAATNGSAAKRIDVLVAAEIATHTLHNTLTPRGAEVRDARLWWKALDKLLARYGETVEAVCATHHWPVWKMDANGELPDSGMNRCAQFLEQQRDTYKFLHDQTVRLINHGYTMLEIAAWFDNEHNLPDFMVDQWHNRGYYGTISHDVRAIYQKYLGWYDMNPSNLNPLPPVEVAKRYISSMGGEDSAWLMLKRACAEKDYRWAAELGKHLVFANPSEANREFLAQVYQKMGEDCEAGTWRDMYLVGAAELRNGGPLVRMGSGTANLSILCTLDDDIFYDFVASRLNAQKAMVQGALDSVSLYIANTEKDSENLVTVRNGVLNWRAMKEGSIEGAIEITVPREIFAKLVLGTMSIETAWENGLETGRDEDKPLVTAFFALFDSSAPNFNIVQPKCEAIPTEIRGLIFSCAQMLECYEGDLIALGKNQNTKVVQLKEDDRKLWTDRFYTQLTVKKDFVRDGMPAPYLEDYSFFCPQGNIDNPTEDELNMGIGNEGQFHKNEYAHFLYECYKKLALGVRRKEELLDGCIAMLEKYVDLFRGKAPDDNTKIDFNSADRGTWNQTYYPLLVRMNALLDDKFFDPTGKTPDWGIGNDCRFSVGDLCNVLERCYKLILLDELPLLQQNEVKRV